MRDNDFRVCAQTRLDTTSFPFPKYHVPFAVAAADPLAIRREPDLTSISSNRVASEALVPRLAEVVGAVDQDLVVEALRGKVLLCISIQMSGQCWVVFESSQMRELTTWMNRDCGHRVHVRLCDILDDNRNVIVPCANRLVIRGSYKSPVFVYECNRIDRS